MSRLVSIVVPAFNEAERITPTLWALASTLRRAAEPFELIVSDDGSTDATAEVCRELTLRMPELTLVSGDTNGGKGAAVRRGMLAARGDVHGFVDADGSAECEELLRLLAELRSGRADIAIASRYVAGARPHGQPWGRVVLSRACNAVVQALLLDGIADPQCGMKLFSREASVRVFAPLRSSSWAFDIEVLARARRAGLRIAELPIRWQDDPRSRVRWQHAWPTLVETVRIVGWMARPGER